MHGNGRTSRCSAPLRLVSLPACIHHMSCICPAYVLQGGRSSTGSRGGGGGGAGSSTARRRYPAPRPQRYDKQKFLQANFRFLVSSRCCCSLWSPVPVASPYCIWQICYSSPAACSSGATLLGVQHHLFEKNRDVADDSDASLHHGSQLPAACATFDASSPSRDFEYFFSYITSAGTLDRRQFESDADRMFDWDDVLLVDMMSSTPIQCPISLDSPPSCPQITPCGHVYSFGSIMQHLMNHGGEQLRRSAPCPLCYQPVVARELRLVQVGWDCSLHVLLSMCILQCCCRDSQGRLGLRCMPASCQAVGAISA